MCTDWKNSHNITLVTTMVIGKLRLYYNKCCFGNMVLKYSLIPMDFKMCRYQRGNFSSKDFVKIKSDKDIYKISHENDMLNCIFHEFNGT